MAYTLGDLRTEGICLTTINEFELSHAYGNHGILTIKGTMEYETCKNQIEQIQENTVISLYLENESGKNRIFSGLVTQIEMEGNGNLCSLVIKAKSFSYCMDVEKKSRTFQDTTMTYHQLVQCILKDYAEADCILGFPDQPLGAIAVQYQETDWEFLKRMLSLIYEPLSCAIDGEKLQLYGGIPELDCREEKLTAKEYTKDMEQFNIWKEIGANIQEIDMFTCLAETEANISLYQKVVLLETPLVVSGLVMKNEKGLIRTYLTLQRKEGVLAKPQYPMHLIGMSIEGTVTNVTGSKIRVQFDIDNGNSSSAIYWFPYSTISASPDGSGWYCMPEKGDKVRVNFPTKDTRDAIAISSVSSYSGKGGNDRMGNSKTKYLRTQNGQVMSLTSGVCLENGPSSLHMGKEAGVHLSTSEKIHFAATDKITLNVTGATNMHSKTQGVYTCKNANLTLLEEGNLQIQGKNLIIG